MLCLSLLVLVSAGCKMGQQPTTVSSSPSQPGAQPAQPATASPSPKFGWKEFHAETFETHALEGKSFYLPHAAAKLRVTVQADSAVFGGVTSEVILKAHQLDHKIIRRPDFARMPCALLSVDKTVATCQTAGDERMVFIVRDARAEGTELAGAVGMKLHSGKLIEHATLPNKIQISLSTWQCVENCKKVEPPPKD